MSYEIPGFSFSLPAAADLSAVAAFRFVDVDTSGLAAVPATKTRAIGVRQNKPAAGEATTIMVSGVSKVEAGASVTAGDYVMVGTDGKAIKAATAGSFIIGVALEGGASGVLIPVLLRPSAAIV